VHQVEPYSGPESGGEIPSLLL